MELDVWLNKIRQAGSKNEIFETLDEFRKLDWTDDQRSKMSKLYIRMLENLKLENVMVSGKEEASAEVVSNLAAAQQVSTKAEAQPLKEGESSDDGPVWYEKM